MERVTDLSLGGIPFGVGLFYALFPYLSSSDRSWMVLGLPDVVRWAGLAASLAVSAFLIWVFATIGTAGSKHIVTFDDMKLATSGPYSRVRHPMYGGFCLWGLTFLLFTDNWAVGGAVVALVVFVALVRVPHEEKVLLEHFGDDYRQYMGRTSRFLPFGEWLYVPLSFPKPPSQQSDRCSTEGTQQLTCSHQALHPS